MGAFDGDCAACGCSPPVGVADGPGAGSTPPAVVLHGATPNPCNPSTTIRFDLAAAGRVRLAIHDLRGRLVRDLVDCEMSAGSHQVVWDGRDARGLGVASGSYGARLRVGGTIAVGMVDVVR